MIYILTLFTFIAMAAAKVTITQIYFDPTTSITKERRDGVIVIESSNGMKSTVCNDDFTSNDAMVVCRMMGYSDGINAFALISSKSSYKDSPIFYSNFTCEGNESSIDKCGTFEYKLADQSCQNHDKDVHVYCNSPRTVSNTFTIGQNNNCDPGFAKITDGNDKMGLMTLQSENRTYTLCGINNNFGENEAQLFCKLLCFKNVQLARIISNYEVKGAPIGGFRNMKCTPNANSLNECSNVYSDDSELCTPADNIGVACESQPHVPEPKPKIICNGNMMTLEWDRTVFPDVETENVNVLENGNNCTDVVKQIVEGTVSLSLRLDRCDPTISENKESLIFRHKIRRLFSKKKQIVVRNTQNFDATCFISRKEIVGDRNINLQTMNMDPAGNIVNLETRLELSTSFDFSTILTMPYSLNIGTRIYGRIILLHAPVQIQLVLQRCVLYNMANDSEVLIEDRCAVRENVKIHPINDNIIKFNYLSFSIRGENLPLSIKCETSKCGKFEIGCISSCQKP